MHNSSDIAAILLFGVTSIQSFPIRTTGQDFLHSCLHLLGLHLSALTIAIRVSLSVSSVAFRLDMFLNQVPTTTICYIITYTFLALYITK